MVGGQEKKRRNPPAVKPRPLSTHPPPATTTTTFGYKLRVALPAVAGTGCVVFRGMQKLEGQGSPSHGIMAQIGVQQIDAAGKNSLHPSFHSRIHPNATCALNSPSRKSTSLQQHAYTAAPIILNTQFHHSQKAIGLIEAGLSDEAYHQERCTL